MRIQDNHAHAITLYTPTNWRHFILLFFSILQVKVYNYSSLTQHLPYEIEHPEVFSKRQQYFARQLIFFGEFLKKIFCVKLYWENAPILNPGIWDLKYGQTNFKSIPTTIEMCIDTGHLMLGSRNNRDAVKKITRVFSGPLKKRIKHLHIHENNLISDLHWNPGKQNPHKRILSISLIEQITKGRTYIYELPS